MHLLDAMGADALAVAITYLLNTDLQHKVPRLAGFSLNHPDHSTSKVSISKGGEHCTYLLTAVTTFHNDLSFVIT